MGESHREANPCLLFCLRVLWSFLWFWRIKSMLKKHYCFLLVSKINQHLPRSVLGLPLQPVELVYRTTECTWVLSGFIVPSPVPLKVLLLLPCVPTWNRSCHLPVTCSLESPVQTSILIHIQFKILFLHVVTSSGLACGLGSTLWHSGCTTSRLILELTLRVPF